MSALHAFDRHSPAVIGILIAGLTTAAALTLPIAAVFILSGSAVIAFLAWLRTGYRRPVRSRGVVAAYLVAVAFQVIHLSEEWTAGFPHEFTDLAGSDREWSTDGFLAVFVFAAVAIWIAAGAASLFESRAANFFLWYYALGAGLINAVAHFIMPVIKGGYFPGLITAPGHLLLSALLIRMLLVEDRSLRLRSRHLAAADAGTETVSTSTRVAVGAAR